MAQKKGGAFLRLNIIVLIVLVIISGILLAISSGGFILNFKQIGFTIISSTQKAVYTVTSSVSCFFTSIKELKNLQTEYEKLTEKLKNYEYLQRDNAEIRKENERLKEQLAFSENYDKKNYAATVIGRDPNTFYSTITINKGTIHGIRKNMPVIAIQNGDVGLVGKIVTVGHNTSMIMPIYDFQCNVSARIQHTRDIGIVSGLGSVEAPLIMKYIKKRVLDELNYGDVIVTSGENDNYMRDIPIGFISKISVLNYDSSLEIEIIPRINFSRLENVFVVDLQEKNNEGVDL
ncbi:MAG: rod shape-determining protein MreC [Treponema sp.]|nr:rod shape-determining protein MreC [Treponema sp.]